MIDATVPLVPLRKSIVQMPPAGSAAQEAFIILGQNALLATAFHNISYENLMIDAQEVECDVLVTGTSKVARELNFEIHDWRSNLDDFFQEKLRLENMQL